MSKILGKGKNGEIATVYDFGGRFIGRGFINHLSKILVRLFIKNDTEEFNEQYLIDKLTSANEQRKKLGFSNCYRAFFAQSDGLPALGVDKYDNVLCVQISCLGMQLNKDLIVSALIKVFTPRGIYERSDSSQMVKEGLSPIKGKLWGDFSPIVLIEENGLNLKVDLEKGQKTGYFLDQKQNRLAIRPYASSGEVLDCFCNAGGFALNAAVAGADKVYALDISKEATDEVMENAKLNGLEGKVCPITCDVFEELRKYKKEGRKFDCIVLDPPAFCKSVAEVKDALRGYKDVNILAMKLLKSGGFLITSSCTHFVNFPLFQKMLTESALESGKTVKLIEMRTQSSDHATLITSDENSYLKFFVLQVF